VFIVQRTQILKSQPRLAFDENYSRAMSPEYNTSWKHCKLVILTFKIITKRYEFETESGILGVYEQIFTPNF